MSEGAANYTPAEERAIAEALTGGHDVRCPQCAEPLERHSVPPRADVSYVRDRLWLTCPGCRRSVLFDRRRLDPS